MSIWLKFIPSLGPHFYGTVPCNRLPDKPDKHGPLCNIVNTDPQGQKDRHYGRKTCVKSWTFTPYQVGDVLQQVVGSTLEVRGANGRSLQSLYDQS